MSYTQLGRQREAYKAWKAGKESPHTLSSGEWVEIQHKDVK